MRRSAALLRCTPAGPGHCKVVTLTIWGDEIAEDVVPLDPTHPYTLRAARRMAAGDQSTFNRILRRVEDARMLALVGGMRS